MRFLTTLILILAVVPGLQTTYAKGAHSCSVHGYYGHFVYVHSSGSKKSDPDLCWQLRKDICSGYLVYRADTMRGILVCSDNAIAFKSDQLVDSAIVYNLSDSNLHAVNLVNKGQRILLVRLRAKDKKLYRLVHEGKMNIYDGSYSFAFDSKNISIDDMVLAYDGVVEDLNHLFTISSKRRLVHKLNEVYHLQLAPGDYTKPQLYSYLHDLN